MASEAPSPGYPQRSEWGAEEFRSSLPRSTRRARDSRPPTLVRLIAHQQAGKNMAMPLHIYRHQRLLFSRSSHGEMLALHGSGEAIIRVLLETPILYDLSPMTFPSRHGCYLWKGTLVEESETDRTTHAVINRFWPGDLQQVSPADLLDIFLGFEDQITGEAILMATYKASFKRSDYSTDSQQNQ
jgi:hypothetical protein